MARSSLREFQERLARRLAEAKTAEHRGLLGFQCGSENWLIPLPEAGEILPPPPLSAVPLTRPWYRGLANVRGTLYGVIDFAQFNGQPPTVPAGRARLLLVGRATASTARCWCPPPPACAARTTSSATPRPTTGPGLPAACATCRGDPGCA